MSEPAGLTAELAGFASRTRFEDLPESVVAHTKLCLLDTVGCGLFGSTLPWVRILRETLAALSGERGSTPLWGTGAPTGPLDAALVNGTAVHGFELDDLHPRSIVHPGSVVTPSALAALELTPRSGRDLLVSVAVGYEVAARVGSAVGAAHLVQGWHPTGTHGALGSAAAAAAALGLDTDETRHALGTAASHSAGLMSAQFSSMVKRLHAGNAARSGLVAALLSQRGFLGIPDVLENTYGGYLATFSPVAYPERVVEGLGEEWEVEKVGFKPYSTNGSCHPSIDALLELRASEGVDLDAVESVRIRCSTATQKHVGWTYTPGSVTTAQMNLPYIVAVVLEDGDAFVDQFTPERIAEPKLVRFSRQVVVEADPGIDALGDTHRHQTSIEVVLRDGRTLTRERSHARGSSSDPLTELEVRAKFRRLAGHVLDPTRVDHLESTVDRLDAVPDARVLGAALAAGPSAGSS